MKFVKIRLALLLLVVWIFGAAGTALAETWPQANQTAPRRPAQEKTFPTTRSEVHRTFLGKLAGELNTSVTSLERALQNASSHTLHDAVSKGYITPERAAKIQAAINRGKWWAVAGVLKPQRQKNRASFNDIAATMGMSEKELREQLASGKTLEEIAASRNTTLEQIKEKWLAHKKNALDRLVSEGKLSRANADNIYAQLREIDLHEISQGYHPEVTTP